MQTIPWKDRAAAISPLLDYARADGSGGVTGILETIFALIPTGAGFGVEFGRRPTGSGLLEKFISQRGWGALYLDREATPPLETRVAVTGKKINRVREGVGPSTINELLAKYDVPKNLDCLVIDIGGLDYWVWKALASEYAPSLVIIEFNAHVGFNVRATIQRDEAWEYQGTKDYGASFAAMCSLAVEKGYRLVHAHGPRNLFFLRDDLELAEALTVKAPLDTEDLAALTDTEAFYNAFLGDRARPTWFGTAPPDVSASPWELLAPDEQTQRVDLDGLSIEVIADKHDVNWYQQRSAYEEKASPLYRLIRDEGFSAFVDIGANVGLISILASRACPSINVVAVEPDPGLARLIRRNFALHGLREAHVINAIAGHEEHSSVGFSLNPNSTLDNRVAGAGWPQVMVPMVPMAAPLARLGLAGKTFIKVDTQGYESNVLLGLESWLAARRDWVLKMEFAPDWLRSQGTDPEALLDYLQSRYEIAEFSGRVAFATPAFDPLFATPVVRQHHSSFVSHVTSLDRDGLGWVDLLVRPRGSPD